MSTHSYEAGDTLVGHRLVRRLGEGGMGSVWEAEHEHLGRRVALKVLAAEVGDSAEVKRRFLQEARLSTELDHPNVVRVFDYQVTDRGEPVIAMELLRGTDLDAHLRTNGPLSLDDARELVVQATAALEEVHSRGVLHRDIKAENLFLVEGPRLRVKLIDFGIARRVEVRDRITRPLEILGTPEYMSPEQMTSTDAVDERGDLFSLAVCVYYALTGSLPFEGDTLIALCLAIHRGTFVPPSKLDERLSPAIDAFFARALAHDPSARFTSAAAMREAFVAASSPPRDTFSAMAQLESPRPRRANGWMVGALCGAIVVVAGWYTLTRETPVAEAAPALPAPTEVESAPVPPVEVDSGLATPTVGLDASLVVDATADVRADAPAVDAAKFVPPPFGTPRALTTTRRVAPPPSATEPPPPPAATVSPPPPDESTEDTLQ